MKVLISTTSFGNDDRTPLNLLEKKGFDIIFNPVQRKLEEKEIKDLIRDVDGLIAGTESLSEDVLKNADNLKVISRCGSGIDNVNIRFAETKNIKIYATKSPAIAVAELTLGLMIDALRNISQLDRKIRSGKWGKSMGTLLTGKTIGIVGMGNIGKSLVNLLKPFNCIILAYDVLQDDEFANKQDISYTHLNTLLNESDIISVHLPLTENTRSLFNKEKFSTMKKDSIFINTSRGEIINENDLYDALKSGKIRFACLDVFNKEPYNGKLLELENTVLTPHIGAYAREERVKMEIESVQNLLKGLEVE
jgi:D-3-phosphoglycerate dehydrogenase